MLIQEVKRGCLQILKVRKNTLHGKQIFLYLAGKYIEFFSECKGKIAEVAVA